MMAVQVQGLVKRYGTVVAVDGLSFEVAEGKFSVCSVLTVRERRQRWSA
jgi:ABC-type multidrug transport system ATPase subunit